MASKNVLSDFAILFILVGIIVLVVWGMSWMGTNLILPFGAFLNWLGARGPWPLTHSPVLILLTLFVAFRLALAPLLVSHARVNYQTGAVRPVLDRAENGTSTLNDYYLGLTILVITLELTLLLFTVWAVKDNADFWVAGLSQLILPSSGLLVKLLFLVVLFVVVTVAIALSEKLAYLFVVKLTRGEADDKIGFLSLHDDVWAGDLIWNLVLVGPPLVFFTLVYGRAPFILTILLCFLLARAVLTTPLEFVSCLLDWRNDRWVRSLGRQVAGDEDPQSRCAAAEKLGRMGRWARPEKATVESAQNDADVRVRTCAGEALVKIG